MGPIEYAYERAVRAQAALDDARFRDALDDARAAWRAVDRQTEESHTAFEAWMRASLIESQAWDYLDRREKAESTARRSLERARRSGAGGPWHARAAIRRIETEEWRQNVVKASLAYLHLASRLETVEWARPLALVCCYQMISCRLKGAPREVGEVAIANGEALVPKIVGSDDAVGSFKRWQAVDLADRREEAPRALERAARLLGESQALKPIDVNRRVRIGESFPAAFLKYAWEAPDAEQSLRSAVEAATAVGLEQYVRGSELLLSRFLD